MLLCWLAACPGVGRMSRLLLKLLRVVALLSCSLFEDFSIAWGCDTFGVSGERGDKVWHLTVSSNTPEFAFGFE